MALALDGIRVLDLTQGLAGPYCAMLLAQYGAEVVKVEPPEGEWCRGIGPASGDRTAAYVCCNHGKRDIVVNLKEPGGRDIVLALAKRADIVMESNRAGVADRLGIGYAAVKALNPDVIYLSVTGFGQEGPYRDRAVTDTLIQAFSGLMTTNIDDHGLPRRVDFPIPDYTTGMTAYQAVVTALLGRARGKGGGCHLDVNLMHSLLAYQQHAVVGEWVVGGKPVAPFPPTGVWRAADGLITVSVVREKYFQSLTRVLGVAGMAKDPRFSSFPARRDNEPAMRAILAERFQAHTIAVLEAKMTADEVPHARVNSFAQAVVDPHVAETRMVSWHLDPHLGRIPLVNPPGVPPYGTGDPRAVAPRLGEHTAVVLGELGYSANEINTLKASGAVA